MEREGRTLIRTAFAPRIVVPVMVLDLVEVATEGFDLGGMPPNKGACAPPNGAVGTGFKPVVGENRRNGLLHRKYLL